MPSDEPAPLHPPAGEPVAVVGVGCRMPGGVGDLEALGEVLTSGGDVLREVPADRWGPEFRATDPGGHGTANHVGGFLDDIDRFDAAYFGVSPKEACFLDPQQRILLEVAWEAMSDSGRPRDAWRRSRTAVFMGMLAGDYNLLQTKTLGPGGIGPHYAGGTEFSFAAGRLAYAFDLRGPVATISSACSSSLLAVHQACKYLRTGECDTAVAGGVGLQLTPEFSIFLSSVGAMSQTGRCRAFDAAADGLVRGEGAGVVVLKRLADARADGDRIYAVVRGSAVTHDGASLGLTAPNASSQAAMLRAAIESAGVGPHDVDYVEAHGTGTQLGDEIELSMLADAYGTGRPAERPLYVGSLKAVFGHLDAAAGVAGLLKAIWVARGGRVPAQPHFSTPNPAVDWANGGITVATETTQLPAAGRPVRTAVSAIGLSGTNVHVIVEAPETAPEPAPGSGPYILLASATHGGLLGERVTRLRERAEDAGERLADLAASTTTRSTFEAYRYAAVGAGRAELLGALGDPDEPPDGAYTGYVLDPDGAPRPVFVYSGQGGQWAGMALDLYDTDATIRSALDECDALIRAEASWSLLEELRHAREEELDRTDLAQPSIFAVQVAVTRWLRERGVTPAAVIGHSLGEVAAAHAAGALSLSDAVRVIVRRAELLHGTAATGLMYAVQASAGTVDPLLAETRLPVSVAAVNGPASVVIAGPAEEVTRAAGALEEHGLRVRRLLVDTASHCRVVAHCGPLLGAAVKGIAPADPEIRLLSSVDSGADSVRPDPAYWARNLTEPVRLWPAVDRLLRSGDHVLVEIGPHPVLVPSLTDALEHRGSAHAAIGTLRRDEPGALALHRTLARLHVAGARVDWEKVTGRPRRYEPQPAPSWGGERYWLPGVERGVQARVAAPERIRLSLLDANGRVTGEMLAQPVDAAPPNGSRPVAPAEPAKAAAAPVRTAHDAPPDAGQDVADLADLADGVEAVVRDVLGLSGGRRLVRKRGLFEQGLDSLTAAELRRRLDAAFGVTLPAPIVFERPTIAALAAYLGEIAPTAAAQGAPETPAAAPVRTAPAGEDAVAVIGIACRLPGADSPDELWTLLEEGRSSVSEPPAGRRDDPVWLEADGIPTRSCYLDDVSGFDAPFFRISPREAKSLDPQQRLFLEVAWEALEDAGRPSRTLAGHPVGVYVGLEAADYQQLLTRHMDNVNGYYGTGASFAAVSGRLSYFLGLSGPSLVVDTACSGSLTAVHLACQGLRNGDCELAVVGGAHVMVSPTMLVAMTESKALARDGRCKTFDDEADGYGCGEGAAVLVLKSLSAAERDGDRVYAVIRGSAVNQDGASGGFTVPNAAAQTALVRQALDRAGWAPDQVDYVEAHGTGTPLGDPIEVNALAGAYGPGRDPSRPLLIGSAKPNVGHLAAAAGAVGLVKIALSLREGRIPPHLVERPSTRIDWDRLPVSIPAEGRPWPAAGRPPRAGVSSFGLTGTNAHVLVEAPPVRAASGDPMPGEPPYVLPLSAASGSALRAVATRMAGRLRAAPDGLPGIVFTATHRRSWLGHRLAVVAGDAAGMAGLLEEIAAGRTPTGAWLGSAVVEEPRGVAFRYGSDDPPRGRFVAVAAYERALAACADELTGLTGGPVDLRSEPPEELRSAYGFCHRVATTELWAAFGVRPRRASGEGDGAVAALWAEGRLSAGEALRILCDGTDRPAGPASGFGPDLLVVAPLDLGDDPMRRIAFETASLFAAGYEPVAGIPPYPPVSLPGYPWEHRAYWYRDLPSRSAVPWVVSGRDAGDLRDAAGRVLAYADGHPEMEPAAIGAALAARPAGPERAVAVGTREELLSGLRALADGREDPAVVTGSARAAREVVLVFPGQGGQWAGMGLDLLDAFPVFAEHLRACEEALRPYAGWSLLEVLRSGDLDRVDVVQPALWAVMVSLARLWQSLGVRPTAVVGHSQGEIAAAHIAGALSLDAAARVSALRAKALTELSGRGGMASLALSRQDALGLVSRWDGRLGLASDNGPASVVVSGGVDAIDELLDHCERHDVRARRIPVDYASHGPHVETIETGLLEAIGEIDARPAEIPMCSALTGEIIDTTTLDATYWYRNLREPVEFQRAVCTLLARGDTVFVEVSPHPVLGFALEETAGADAIVPTLRRDDGGPRRLYTSLALAHLHTGIDWRPLFAGTEAAPLDAPVAAEDVTGEAEFWAAVEREDAEGLAATVGLESGALDALVPVLAAWRRRQRLRSAADSWRYRIVWTPVPEADAPVLPGTWLVVTPDGAIGPWIDGCARALADHGAGVRPVPVPATTGRAELADLLRTVTGGDKAPAGVVSLLALAEGPADAVVPAGLAATVTLVQALGDAGVEAPLWVLTGGAVSTGAGDRIADPVQAQVLGLTRVLALDEPGRWGGQVDLPATADERACARLASALSGIGDEDQLGVRGSGILARRLVPAPLTGRPRTWRPHGTVLVTGGTGALGGHVARRLAREGAGHLLLLSRRGPEAPGAAELGRELTDLGAEVTIAACDIADSGALAAVLADVPAEHPLTAVVHTAAAVGRRISLDGVEPHDLAESLSAKAAGARNLDRLLGDVPLEAFVLFTSGAGVWGSGGQGPYAAANAYLDALAEDRRARGLPATSVAWGAWAGEGGSSGEAETAFLARHGVRAMAPERAVEALWRALEHDETFVAVADVDWPVFAEGFTAARPRPLIADLPGVRRSDAPSGRRTDGAALAERLTPLPRDARERLLLDVVRAEVARVLQHDDPATIEADRAFKELGFDSVTGVELRNRLGAVTGLRLAAGIVFDHPTPTELTRHLLAGLLPGEEINAIDAMDVADLVQLAHRDGSC